jgi:hypothetical protein
MAQAFFSTPGIVLSPSMQKSFRSRLDRPGSSRQEGFVLGRDHFARISAIEGIALTADMREFLDRFDREELSAAERRRAIVDRFAPTR